MLRASVFSVVLTLLAGPSAGMLCKTWCDPVEAARTGCHHDDTATAAGLTGDRDCDDVAPSSAVLVREEVRRGVSDQDVRHALVVPRHQFLPPSGEADERRDRRRASPLESRPLVTALRI